MNPKTLKSAVDLAEGEKYTLIATADSEGVPHIAIAKKIVLKPDNHLEITGWFCPQTIANLWDNKSVTLAVWDEKTDRGYQLLGRAQMLEDMAILDGFAPRLEDKSIPQVERKLTMLVEKITDFRHARHSDTENNE